MPRSCPLCGKTKPEEALFCNDCATKIHAEYEVDVPLKVAGKNALTEENTPICVPQEGVSADLRHLYKEAGAERENGLRNAVNKREEKPIPGEAIPEEPESTEPEQTEPESKNPESTEPGQIDPESTEPEPNEPESNVPESTVPESSEPGQIDPESTEPEQTEPESTEPEQTEPEQTEPEVIKVAPKENEPLIPSPTTEKKTNRVNAPALFVLLIALLTGAFFVYNATIRKNNLDRSSWEAAVKANSTEGYLAYMEAHPQGAHFDEAQAGLYKIKADEAEAWKRMKETDNVAELRNFLDLHPRSPYVPLVKTRVDSLIWTGTLRTNTAESYSDYILLTEKGGIGGDYVAEARKRYALLSNSQSVDKAVSDSIRTTIGGFFTALSSLNHSGMYRFLAPTVYRFFNSGAATREKITGELLVTGAHTGGGNLQFIPDLESVRYEIANNNHYKVNVSLQKSYPKNGATMRIYGYIVHLELNPLFQIIAIFETKPWPEAP